MMTMMLDVFVHRVQTIFLQIAFVAFASIAIFSWLCLGVFAICVENFKPFLRFVFDACVNGLWRMWRLVFESTVTSVRFLLFFGRRREEEVKEEEEEDEEETPEQQQKRSSSSKTKNIHLLKAPLEKLLQTHPEIFSFHISPHLDKNISNFAACSRECFEASIKAKSRLPTLPEEISNIRTVQMCKLALDRGLDVNNRQNIHALIRGNGANSLKNPNATIAIIRHLVRERPIVKEKILKRDPECVRNAAYNHTDKVVKYLVEQCEAKFDESACLWASLLGNIKALRYLREVKNCPWNKVDCMRAAYGCEDAYKRRKICEWIEKQPYNSRV
ncbi:unnamed protein product [Bathycoccus prasinos]|jgi:hypothetical protein